MTRDFEGHSDIVDRLRDRLRSTPASIGWSDPGVELDTDLLHAVEEIEKLRHALAVSKECARSDQEALNERITR